jgi:NAD(P)-dependent dehydrogenase (short-subunit alcohol dehydrogenase family)
MAVPYKLTVDSLESHFQINYLSHFLLINLLLPSMKAAAEVSGVTGRIVNVSSSAQYDRKVDFGDLELRQVEAR